MKLIYGYEMATPGAHIGHVVCPPLLSRKITVSSGGNTTRWIFYGTRKQIIQWMRDHSHIILENSVFNGGHPSDSHIHTELVIDLQYAYDNEQSYADFIKSYFVDIFEVERVKVEIRARVESKDSSIASLNRSIVASGTTLGEIVDDLEKEWNKPGESYLTQTVHLFNDEPVHNHIISAKPPTSVHVVSNESQQAH
ncbi:hypothetical protein BDB01DRAFT_778811 [Pilobolus umbonatus]|nr:hypothetical protein BDB01DRAFT_778811 [Pilobolus umbonatus]